MEEETKQAMESVDCNNEFDNDFLIAELDKIIDDIKNGECDESFLYYAIELVKKHQSNKSMEDEMIETRARK